MSLPALPVADLLRRHNLHPDKRLGQNFLVDETALNRVVAAAALQPGEEVLEIGPGLGSLTRHLAAAGGRVAAVELDERLLPALREVVSAYPNVEIIQGDILKLNPAALVSQDGFAVVANIPYYITSAVIRHLLEARPKPSRIVLTVQKEVAERICASPGDLSILALSVLVYGQPQIAGRIPAGAFYPAPKVDSAVVRIDLFSQPRLTGEALEAYFRLVKAGFSQKRKNLRNALSGGLGISASEAGRLLGAAGIDAGRRAETLNLAEWQQLAAEFLRLSPARQQ